MIHAGIYEGDILIVDRSLATKDGNIIIAVLNGEFTVKRLQKKRGPYFLTLRKPQLSSYKSFRRNGL